MYNNLKYFKESDTNWIRASVFLTNLLERIAQSDIVKIDDK